MAPSDCRGGEWGGAGNGGGGRMTVPSNPPTWKPLTPSLLQVRKGEQPQGSEPAAEDSASSGRLEHGAS